jgi:hypothetical protein
MKINFTKEHEEKLDKFIVKMWKDDIIVTGKLGQPLNICELKTLSPNSLNELKLIYDKKISNLESKDEWINPENDKLDLFKFIREGLNLLVGFKRKIIELNENARKKEELTAKLTELKESTKTPEDRIKELETQLKELEEF